MKKAVILLVCSFFTLALWGQHETLFKQARVVGGFGAPIFEWGINNDIKSSVGGGGGVVINNVFIGAYGLGSVDFDKLINNDDIEQVDLGHGGLWLGYTYRPYTVIHPYISSRIGWGAVNIKVDSPGQRFEDLDKIFAFTPEIGLELNVTKWFRLAGTVGYRWVTGVSEERGYRDEDFSGAMAAATLRFGWFGWRRDNY